MKFFTRDDGALVRVVEGFRERVLSYRAAVTPREEWRDADYAAAAAKKRRRFRRLADKARTFGFDPENRRVLDAGCGDGSNALLFASHGARVNGIDLHPLLLGKEVKDERARCFAAHLMGKPDSEALHQALQQLPLELQVMDATQMTFADDTFDFVMSRSAMEHVRPLAKALHEIVRVSKPGGLIYLSVDPFYWVRGCHKRGVVDIPWAHARLTLAEFHRFVRETEGVEAATKRCERIETLNRLTLGEWKSAIETTGCAILEWAEDFSSFGEGLLAEIPDVPATLLPGVTQRDLLHERIRVWLRRRA
ncbi:MAG TPA: class I SAM-dependent methyltransferase [Verrucomicrobiae bacterium]